MELEIGLTYTSEKIVEEKDSAAALGSGTLTVFATPAMILLMENAAMMAVRDALPQGSTTVGMMVDVRHLFPTRLGAKVSAIAELVDIKGKILTFEIEAHDEKHLIGKGVHRRAVVDIERFIAKMAQ